MNQFDRTRLGRLPQWRTGETGHAAPQPADVRTPVLRPADFLPAKPKAVSLIPDAPVAEDAPPPPRVPAPLPVSQPVPDTVPARPSAEAIDPSGPLLDVRSAISAVLSRRLMVLSLSVVGALAGAVVLPMLPQKFTAGTTLFFDPRQVGLADPSAQSTTPSPEMISAMIDSQVQILTSGNVLRRVADAMKLDQDREFTGGRPDSAAVISALQKALVISRQGATYVVSLTATTTDPQKSAALANQVVASFLKEEDTASTGLYEGTANTLDSRLNDLRAKVQEAEQAVETYRADNDMTSTQNGLISDQRLTSLNTLLVTAQDKTIQAKTRADAAANLRFEDIVGGSQQDAGVSTALSTLRQQYSTQAAIVGSLQSQMGARHPRLQAARSSLKSIADEIQGELQRLATTARAEYDQAKKAEDAISKELAVQKALQVNTSDKQVELNELQRKAAAARDIYETVLKRSSQTSEEQNLSRSNIRVISEAEPPIKPNGPSKKMFLVAGAIGGLLAGFAAGVGFAILASLITHPVIRGYFRKPA
ncbi:GumC family protein [Rhizobium sp. S96]|uniref:GumC family protein n=1 Tax=Rhizobium sp. S96 TaxID=3055140 RepID=UPI0025AA64D9|nr:GumC family protein [Rhizobium sp. S96]MDM9619543.1 GumC family protein [Rhizobium sp. S96]